MTGTPGHWSDWQPGFTFIPVGYPADITGGVGIFAASLDTDASVGYTDVFGDGSHYEGHQLAHPPDPVPFPDVDLRSYGHQSILNARNGPRADDLFIGAPGIEQVFMYKTQTYGDGGSYPSTVSQTKQWEAWVRISQGGKSWQANLDLQRPPTVEFGVDYEYEGGPTGTAIWQDTTVTTTAHLGGVGENAYGFGGAANTETFTFTETFEVWAIPAMTLTNGVRVDATSGIMVAEFTLSMTLTPTGPQPETKDVTLHFSRIPWNAASLIYQPRTWHTDGDDLFIDIPEVSPPDGSYHFLSYGIQPDVYWFETPPTYRLRTPRYRYWIPPSSRQSGTGQGLPGRGLGNAMASGNSAVFRGASSR